MQFKVGALGPYIKQLIMELKTRFAVGFISVIRPTDKQDKQQILINGEK